MFCSSCDKEIDDNSLFCIFCGNKIDNNVHKITENFTSNQGLLFEFGDNSDAIAYTTPSSYEYKILAQKDKLFSGKFDPANLERAMNAYAQQGWRAISCSTADISGFGKRRQEFVAVFEREVK